MRCFRPLNRLALVAALAAPLAACQDHHWVDFDKMGEVKMAERPAGAPKEPVTTEGRPGVPYEGAGMLSGNNMSSTPEAAPEAASSFAGVIAAGTVDVDPADKAKAEALMTLYVIVRPAGGGAPVAAARATGVTFPYAFRLTEENVMMTPPQPGQAIAVEARLDSDGDPISKDAAKDLFAPPSGETVVGNEKISLTLKSSSGG
ncbi:MAG: hypothetical protein HQK87_04035 [Nitrospinae bacterium]|nr:hypothetical protein [Nitrospinota bacterium]